MVVGQYDLKKISQKMDLFCTQIIVWLYIYTCVKIHGTVHQKSYYKKLIDVLRKQSVIVSIVSKLSIKSNFENIAGYYMKTEFHMEKIPSSEIYQ